MTSESIFALLELPELLPAFWASLALMEEPVLVVLLAVVAEVEPVLEFVRSRIIVTEKPSKFLRISPIRDGLA